MLFFRAVFQPFPCGPVNDMTEKNFKKTFFRREIRRVNISRMAVCIAALICILLLDTKGTIIKASAKRRKPEPIDPSVLTEITDPETQLTPMKFPANLETSHAFDSTPSLRRLALVVNGSCQVTFTPDKIVPSGYIAYEQNGKPSENVEYVFAVIGEKMILVRRSVWLPLDTLTGIVGYLPSDILLDVLSASDTEAEAFLPIFIDCTLDTFSSVKTSILFSVVLLFLWSVWFYFVFRDLIDWQRSAAYKRIFMCHGTVEENAFQIDNELAQRRSGSMLRNIYTENWHIKRGLFSFMVEPMSSIGGDDNRMSV